MLVKAKEYQRGLNSVVDSQKYPEAKMDFEVLVMEAGDVFTLEYDRECALLLMFGEAEIKWEGNAARIRRASCFYDAPYCLCTPKGVAIGIEAFAPTQFAVMTAENNKEFESKLYTPDDAPNENRGAGTLGECSTRIVRSIRGRGSFPQTNFFMGEVVNSPGKWSSFPPHSHPEPEIYYYKFLPAERHGYGFSQDGYDDAHVVYENDALVATDGKIHAQVAAPGYAMYYVWVIRDFDEKPHVIPPAVERYRWTTEEGAKYFPEI